MKQLVSFTCLAFALLVCFPADGRTVELPVFCTFDGDAVDAPPHIGGADQPTSLLVPAEGSILVRDAANGIDTQPCEIFDGATNIYGNIEFSFTPYRVEVLRVEATVAFDHLVNGYFLQTAASTDAVATRLMMNDDGMITDYYSVTLGSYEPNVPFRVRVDVDMATKTWSATVDNEMNGFEDDDVFTGLPFLNNPEVVPDIAGVHASLKSSWDVGVTRIAYDDISIAIVEVSPVAASSWSSVKSLYAN